MYNDKVHTNGKAMGHWWIEILSGTGELVDVEEFETINRLIRVDHRTGYVEHVMTLNRQYDGLASTDGNLFYASCDEGLYAINLYEQTETRVGSLPSSRMQGLEFAGDKLMGFENNNHRLLQLSTGNGNNLGVAVNHGDVRNLGAIVFSPLPSDPFNVAVAYD